MAPKRYRFAKIAKRGKLKGLTSSALMYGSVGLMAVEPGRITARQIEAARRSVRRGMARVGRLWVRVQPRTPVTKKPIEVRMGGGVGSIKYWASVVKAGSVLFEVRGVDAVVAEKSLLRGANKLPIHCKIVHRVLPPVQRQIDLIDSASDSVGMKA